MSTSSRTTCPVASVCPCRTKFRRRISSGAIPSSRAMTSRCLSSANSDCGAPNPRKAPCGGAFVATARAWMRTWSTSYGPAAWMHPRDSTTCDSVEYAPPSTTKSMSSATSFPSRVTAVRCRVRDGCRFVVAAMSSARS
jgi:hypothetical protein